MLGTGKCQPAILMLKQTHTSFGIMVWLEVISWFVPEPTAAVPWPLVGS